MTAYWLLFAYFAAGSLLSSSAVPGSSRGRVSGALGAGLVFTVVLVGLRFEVGADWPTYKMLFSYAGYSDLRHALAIGDPGYQLINWTVRNLGAEIWLVNLICATIFGWGLLRFAQAQPRPWLAILVAVPYLIIVVAMGYTRQAVAIGILMAGLAAFQRGASTLRFATYVVLAALFHKTAVVALPLVVFASEKNRLVNIFVGLVACYFLYTSFLADSVDNLIKNYINAHYSSQGAAIRVAMNILPATLFLFFRRRLGYPERERRVWLYHSIAAFGLLALLVFVPSSTAVDRLALYVMPLQMAVLSRIPNLVGSRPGTALVVLYSFAIQFVWLNFAVFARAWVPYHFYPFA